MIIIIYLANNVMSTTTWTEKRRNQVVKKVENQAI